MSDRKTGAGQTEPPEEPFLERWLRRKSATRHEPGANGPAVDAGAAAVDGPAEAPPGQHATTDEIPATLPDLDQLGADADYSAFLGPRVDAALRRKALRKLFHSPKFNVCDGLDDYCDDFTQFGSLGDVVTADMRFQMEQAAKRLEAALDHKSERSPTESPAATEHLPGASAAASDPTNPSEQDDDDDLRRTS